MPIDQQPERVLAPDPAKAHAAMHAMMRVALGALPAGSQCVAGLDIQDEPTLVSWLSWHDERGIVGAEDPHPIGQRLAEHLRARHEGAPVLFEVSSLGWETTLTPDGDVRPNVLLWAFLLSSRPMVVPAQH